MSMTNCSKCKRHIDDLSQEGKYLIRTSPKGESFVGQCAPHCEYDQGSQEAALLGALEDGLCEHGKSDTDYCEPCGRINGG